MLWSWEQGRVAAGLCITEVITGLWVASGQCCGCVAGGEYYDSAEGIRRQVVLYKAKTAHLMKG